MPSLSKRPKTNLPTIPSKAKPKDHNLAKEALAAVRVGHPRVQFQDDLLMIPDYSDTTSKSKSRHPTLPGVATLKDPSVRNRGKGDHFKKTRFSAPEGSHGNDRLRSYSRNRSPSGRRLSDPSSSAGLHTYTAYPQYQGATPYSDRTRHAPTGSRKVSGGQIPNAYPSDYQRPRSNSRSSFCRQMPSAYLSRYQRHQSNNRSSLGGQNLYAYQGGTQHSHSSSRSSSGGQNPYAYQGVSQRPHGISRSSSARQQDYAMRHGHYTAGLNNLIG